MDHTKTSGHPVAPAQLEVALANLEEAVVILDPEWTITYVNGSFGRMFDVSARSSVGVRLDLTLNGRIDAQTGARILAKIGSGATWSGVLTMPRSDGTLVELTLTASPMMVEGGPTPTGYVVVLRDVTTEKGLHAKLRNAVKLEAIGTLAGGIAHDFNNILSAVLGFAELAAMDAPKGSDLADNINEVLVAGRRARDLVRQILTFSRQTDLKAQPFVMKPLIAEATKLLRSSLPSTIEIGQNIASDSPIMGDPSEVHQVLVQLCTNASLAMPEGGVLKISLTDQTVDANSTSTIGGLRPGDYVVLTVTDTGIGMSEEVKARVFDPFFTTRDEGEGKGLGLAMVHGVVRKAGGFIEVESEPGRGSGFKVYWPRLDPARVDDEFLSADLPLGSERVLFVDDEEFQVTLARKMLGSLGYRVTALSSPVEALELFKKEPTAFDLVVTDITMPKMTGIEFAREVKALRPEVPVIMCTGYSQIAADSEADYLGADALIAKPIVMRRMAQTIRGLLD